MRSTLLVLTAASLVVACGSESSGGSSGSESSGTGTGTGGGSSQSGVGGALGTGAGSNSGVGGGAGGGQAACVEGVEVIELAPADSVVKLDGVSAKPITFTATGLLKGGGKAPLDASKLKWAVSRADETDPGLIKEGVLTPNPLAGGVVTVTAEDGCDHAGATKVTFQLESTVGTPADPGAWAGAPVGEGAPTIVYPSDQTRFPRNLYRTVFQWQKLGFSQFRLVFEGPYSKVAIYSDGVHGQCAEAVTAGCWEVDEKTWQFIAGSNAGATAKWSVDALDTTTSPPTIRRSAPIEIGFSKQDVKGAIFYWSTTVAGIRRGRISQKDPENYVAGKEPQTVYPTDNAVGCVACHTVSRSGKYMVAPTKADPSGLWIYEVTKDAPPTPQVTDIPDTGGHGFGTISPDDASVVAAYGGKMWEVDRATGAHKKDLPTGDLEGTHPDWSPKGDEVVFVTGSGDGPGGASLARIPYNNGAWGAPSVFIEPAAGKTLNWPMFSPNADWIAYNLGKGGHKDEQAQLMLISAAGGPQIELINANRVVNNKMTDGIHQNTGPTWAPPGDLHWVAFNSQREYGVILHGGRNQIWVAAVDIEKAKQGVDPSYPAFRVPFQGLDEANHRAFWTLDIADPAGTGGGGGAGGGGGGGNGGAGGGSASSGPAPCADILTIGEACDPIHDCCETGSYCDSNDGGVTHSCITNYVPK